MNCESEYFWTGTKLQYHYFFPTRVYSPEFIPPCSLSWARLRPIRVNCSQWIRLAQWNISSHMQFNQTQSICGCDFNAYKYLAPYLQFTQIHHQPLGWIQSHAQPQLWIRPVRACVTNAPKSKSQKIVKSLIWSRLQRRPNLVGFCACWPAVNL